MDLNLLWIALGSGLLSFSMPCNLIALPSFLIYLSLEGVSLKKAFIYVVIYGIGFTLVFTTIGIALLFVQGFILQQKWIQIVGGGIIMLIGVIFALGLFNKKVEAPSVENDQISDPLQQIAPPLAFYDPKLQAKKLSYSRCFFLGISLGTSGFSCVLPIFSPILVLIATSADITIGVLILICYCIGILVPYIILGLFIGKFNEKLLGKIIRFMPIIKRIFGVILIIMGFLYLRPALVMLGYL